MTEPDSLDEREIEEAVARALAKHPSAGELQPLVEALRARRTAYRTDAQAAATAEERARWETRISEVDRQIAALEGEAAISGFVEFTVRTAAPRARPQSDPEDEEA